MAFKKGESGNPGGRSVSKPFAEQLRLVLQEETTDRGKKIKKIRKLAQALVDKALEGDISAMREIADRTEGKPHQSVEQKIDASVKINLVDYSDYDHDSK